MSSRAFMLLIYFKKRSFTSFGLTVWVWPNSDILRIQLRTPRYFERRSTLRTDQFMNALRDARNLRPVMCDDILRMGKIVTQ